MWQGKWEHTQIMVIQIKCLWEHRREKSASHMIQGGKELCIHVGDSSRGWKVMTRSPVKQEGGRGDDQSPHPHPSALTMGLYVCCSGNSMQEKAPLRSEVGYQALENDWQLLA